MTPVPGREPQQPVCDKLIFSVENSRRTEHYRNSFVVIFLILSNMKPLPIDLTTVLATSAPAPLQYKISPYTKLSSKSLIDYQTQN